MTMPNGDNPVNDVHTNVMRSGYSKALERIIPESMYEESNVGHLLHSTDKYGLTGALHHARRIRPGDDIKSLLNKHKALVFSSESKSLRHLSDFLKRTYGMRDFSAIMARLGGISGGQFVLSQGTQLLPGLESPAKLWFGAGLDASSYRPLMVGATTGLSSGLVSMGGIQLGRGTLSSRGVSSMTRSFYGMFSHTMGWEMPTSIERFHSIHKKTMADPSLGPLIEDAPFTRGRQRVFEGVLESQRNRVAFGSDHPLMQARVGYLQAIKDIGIGGTVGSPQLLARAEVAKRRYAEALVTEFGSATPLIKPEHLMGEGPMLAPSKALTDIFGTAYTTRQFSKGMFQEFRRSVFDSAQVSMLEGMGVSPMASYMTRGAFNLFKDTPALAYNQMGLKTMFVDPSDPIYKLLNLGDSGGIITPGFGEKALRARRDIGTITLAGWDAQTVQSLNKVFPKLKLDARMMSMPGGFTYRPEVSGRIHDKAALADLMSRSKGSAALWKALQSGRIPGGAMLREIQLQSDHIKLHFGTKSAIEARQESIVMAGRRLTLSRLDRSSPHYTYARNLGRMGVGAVVALEDAAAMHPRQLFLHNYLSTAQELATGNVQTAKMFGLTRKEAVQHGMKLLAGLPIREKLGSMPIHVIDSEQSMISQVRNNLSQMMRSRDDRTMRVAKAMTHGLEVTTDSIVTGAHKHKLGYKRGFIMNTLVAQRPDAFLDISPMKPLEFGAQKLAHLFAGAGVLGYAQPSQDPMYNLVARRMGMEMTRLGDFRLPKHMQSYLSSLMGAGPRGGLLLGMHGGQMGLTDMTTGRIHMFSGSLPDYDKFGWEGMGVHQDDVRGTVINPNDDMRQLMRGRQIFVDLGSEKQVPLAGDVTTPNKLRYAPLPLDIVDLRANQANRFVQTRGTAGNLLVKLLSQIQGGVAAAGTFDTYGALTQRLIETARGKQGWIQGGMVARFATGLAVRPISPGGMVPTTAVNDVLTVRIARKDLSGYLDLMETQPGGARVVRRVRKDIARRGSTIISLGSDPAQRAEHMMTARLQVVDKLRAGNLLAMGQTSVEVNPMLMRILERDHDMDVVRMLFAQAEDDTTSRNLWNDRLNRTKARLSKNLAFMEYEQRVASAKGGVRSLHNIMTQTKMSIKDMVDSTVAYLGSKADAPRGYTITRAVQNFMPMVRMGSAGEAMSHLTSMGANVTGVQDDIKYLVETVFRDNIRADLAQTLAQALYQGGVIKGGQKSALSTLHQELASVRHLARQGTIGLKAGTQKAERAFFTYLQSMDKTRYGLAMDALVEAAGEEPAIQRMLADLRRGSVDAVTYKSVRESLDRQAAGILADYFGSGYWLGGAAPSLLQTRNITSMTFGGSARQVSSAIEDSPESVLRDVFRPVVGPGNIQPSVYSGGAMVQPGAARSEVAETFSSKFGRVFEGRAGLIKAGLIGALGGFIAGQAFQEEAPLPPEPLLDYPTDTSPRLPSSYTAPVRLSPAHPDPMDRQVNSRPFSRITNLNGGFAGANVNIQVQDDSRSMSQYEMERRMRQIAASDFVV